MPRRRLIAAPLLALALGLFTNFALATILGLYPSRSSWGTGIIISHEDGAYSLLHENMFGRTAISMRRFGPGPKTITDLRAAFITSFPNGVTTDPRSNYPTSPDIQARLLLPHWSVWAAGCDAKVERTVLATGFPLKTLVAHQTGPRNAPIHSSGLLFWRSGSPGQFIPFIPLPLGTAVNTVLFSCPWFLALIALPPFRRQRRLRRGHCPRCNYDLRADFPSGCPECGWNRSQPATVLIVQPPTS